MIKKKNIEENEIELSNQEEEKNIKNEVLNTKKKNDNKANNNSVFKTIIVIISFLAAVCYYLYYVSSAFDTIEYAKNIINASIIIFILLLSVIALLGNKKTRNVFSVLSSIMIIIMVCFNLGVSKQAIKLPKLNTLSNLVNKSLSDVMTYVSKNNIKVETTYEYSDNVKEGYVISQDISEGTKIKDVDLINLVISDGPSYDKELILPNYIGRTLDELLKFITDNHLSNTDITFTVNNSTDRNIVISQNTKGEIKRSSKIKFEISLGNKESLEEIKLDNLINKTLFDSTLFLKQNGIKYEVKYSYSDTISKGHVIETNPNEGEMLKPFDTVVTLTLSKGKEIIVPDFSNKTVDDVVNWVIDNKLKISYNEEYSPTVKKDDLIKINYKSGESVEEGTKIIITTSKGPIIVPNFKSLAEFRSWASENDVNYSEQYEYNDDYDKGKIINLSIKSGSVVDPKKDKIIVKVSYGSAVVVPNFVSKTKSAITSECNKIGLNCTFYYTGFNTIAKDTATKQSVTKGTKVVSGTYVSIGLSSGPAKKYSVFIQSEWFGRSASTTISNLKSKLSQKAPGVTFNFVKKKSNSCVPGFIHQDSPIKAGQNTFTQGKTYTIWVMDC